MKAHPPTISNQRYAAARRKTFRAQQLLWLSSHACPPSSSRRTTLLLQRPTGRIPARRVEVRPPSCHTTTSTIFVVNTTSLSLRNRFVPTSPSKHGVQPIGIPMESDHCQVSSPTTHHGHGIPLVGNHRLAVHREDVRIMISPYSELIAAVHHCILAHIWTRIQTCSRNNPMHDIIRGSLNISLVQPTKRRTRSMQN